MLTKNNTRRASKTPYLDLLQHDGYVVLRNLIPSHQVEELREASEHIARLARDNQWPYVRTVPKQYPPWPENSSGTNIWGVQHLLHPSMPNRNIFANLYFGSTVLDVVRQLIYPQTSSSQNRDLTHDGIDRDERKVVNPEAEQQSQTGSKVNDVNATTTYEDNDQLLKGTSDIDDSGNKDDNDHDNYDKLVMELFNLLISPDNSQSFSLGWHRDDIRPTLTPQQEQLELDQKSPRGGQQLHAQYNIALTDHDTSLIVIPGSHARVRTNIEREATLHTSQSSNNNKEEKEEINLPNQVHVTLNAGDAVFYNSNILHRGVYDGIDSAKETGRLTLHGCVGLVGHDNARARQVLQHGVGEWVDRSSREESKDGEDGEKMEFGLEDGRVALRAKAMRKRLVDMGKGVDTELGYSLEG